MAVCHPTQRFPVDTEDGSFGAGRAVLAAKAESPVWVQNRKFKLGHYRIEQPYVAVLLRQLN